MGNPPTHLQIANPGEAEHLRARLLPLEQAGQLSRQGQALSDPTRLILMCLIRDMRAPACVGDLCLISGVEQSGVSRHLRILWNSGLLSRRVLSRSAIYELTEDGERLLAALLNE